MPQRLPTPETIVKIFAILLCTSLSAAAATAQQSPFHLNSPSGNLRATIFGDVDGSRHLGWSLELNGKPLVLPSALGIEVGGNDLGQDVTVKPPALTESNTSYPWAGVHNTAINHYRQALFAITAKNGTRYGLECRIFDDGFAFRYIVPPGPGSITNGHPGSITNGRPDDRITGESSSWHLPTRSQVWYQENIYYYEGLHYTSSIENLGAKQLGPPVTYQTADGLYATITEAALYNYSGMSLRSDGHDTLHAAFVNDSAGWKISGVITTPWRVVLASSTLNGLVNSDIIPDLNPAPDTTHRETSWIRPGRAVWSYFVHDNVTTLALEKTYVDKAAALGFEYSIVDAGWDSSWPNALDSLKSLVRYAAQKHVRIFVWKSYASLKDDSTRKAFFDSMHHAGVAGLKIDYIDKEGIDQVRFYEKALQDGLQNQLMIDFHGANKPTGYNRRFPNEITREGIYGQEWRTYTPQGSINNAIIPFTRFLAGPADYTPGVFNSSLAYGTSRAQQLALPVIYNSPLLCWADDPAVYLASPAQALIRAIPTTWDETRVLSPSKIGELVVFARRKGTDWFIGIINAGDEKRLDLPLTFLGAGPFKTEIVSDDLTSSDRILHSITSVTAADSLPVILKAKGGFVAHLIRTNQPLIAITIQPAGGYLQGPQTVRIVTSPNGRSSHPPGAIRYTTDGSNPDSRSPVYTGSLILTQPALLRARLFTNDIAGTTDVVAQFLAAPAPMASPSAGIFIGQQSIGLSTNLPGEIRYTTDGTDPDGQSQRYKDPILLDTTTILKSRVFFAAGGVSEISNQHFEKVTPDPAISTPDATPAPDAGKAGKGLTYTYYEGKWDSMPRFDQLTAIKHGRANALALDSLPTRAIEYGLQFKGYINLPETGVYTFYTISDDGSMLYIGDQKVVDNDGCHGDLERSGDRALTAGKHPFTLNYFQNGSGQTLQVFIKGPHLEKQPIPASFFSNP